jgi:hypothetical protein
MPRTRWASRFVGSILSAWSAEAIASQAALPHVKARQLSGDVGRLRIELRGALECADGAVDVFGGFQVPAQKELGVRLAGPLS